MDLSSLLFNGTSNCIEVYWRWDLSTAKQTQELMYFKIIGEEINILFIYVDDALFMGSNKTQVLSHKAQFMK